MLFWNRLEDLVILLLLGNYLAYATETSIYSASTGGIGCQYGTAVGTINGFAATFYSYPNGGSAAGNTGDGSVSTSFFQYSYSEYGLFGSTTGVTVPSISYGGGSPDRSTSVFGVEVSGNHFVMELDGYFFATTSGVYTLVLDNVDDYAAIWFGTGLSCCDPTTPDDSIIPDFATGRSNNENTNGGSEYSVYLTAGSYYPIKIRYANVLYAGDLIFSVVDPSGNVIDNFDGYVYQFVNVDGLCTTVTATLPLSTTTVTTDVPSTTTTTEDVTYTSDGNIITSSIVVIEDPPLSTLTVYTDILTPSTTTELTTYPVNGTTITSSIVIIDQPILSTTNITTNVDSVTTTTEATEYTSDGKTISTTVVVVEEPPLSTTTTWTNVDSVTTTTEATEYTSDGKTISTTVVVVEEPPLSTITVNTNVDSVTTTTEATEYISDGKTISTTVVVVEEPPMSRSTVTSDVQREIVTTVMSGCMLDGIRITSGFVLVEVPSQAVSIVVNSGDVSTLTSQQFGYYSNTSVASRTMSLSYSSSVETITTDVECSSKMTDMITWTSHLSSSSEGAKFDRKTTTVNPGYMTSGGNIVTSTAPVNTDTSGIQPQTRGTEGMHSVTKNEFDHSSSSGSWINGSGKGSGILSAVESRTSTLLSKSKMTANDVLTASEMSSYKFGSSIKSGKETTTSSDIVEPTLSTTSLSISSPVSSMTSPDASVYEGAAVKTHYNIQVIVSVLVILLI